MEPKLYTAYIKGGLHPVTASQCDQYDWEAIEVSGSWGYTDYFIDRWANRIPFINVEQDVITWPGAIESLWNCSEEWCAFTYEGYNTVPVLGCCKFTASFINRIPKVWIEQKLSKLREPGWYWLDGWLWQYLNHEYPHMHYPNVINAVGSKVATNPASSNADVPPPKGQVIEVA